MRIGIILASSQAEKNRILYEAARHAAPAHEIRNFGCFPGEKNNYSYVETALHAALLLNSKAIDFIITGCSSGQGMMLACNSLPGVLCGYAPTPQDAFLFGRINDGNALSLPLGLGYGWAGELNLRFTLNALFAGDFGCGYPPEQAERKCRDGALVKKLKSQAQKTLLELLQAQDEALLAKIFARRNVIDYILRHGKHDEL